MYRPSRDDSFKRRANNKPNLSFEITVICIKVHPNPSCQKSPFASGVGTVRFCLGTFRKYMLITNYLLQYKKNHHSVWQEFKCIEMNKKS